MESIVSISGTLSTRRSCNAVYYPLASAHSRITMAVSVVDQESQNFIQVALMFSSRREHCSRKQRRQSKFSAGYLLGRELTRKPSILGVRESSTLYTYPFSPICWVTSVLLRLQTDPSDSDPHSLMPWSYLRTCNYCCKSRIVDRILPVKEPWHCD